MVKLTHPAGGKVEATADAVPMYRTQGWVTSPKAKASTEDDEKDK